MLCEIQNGICVLPWLPGEPFFDLFVELSWLLEDQVRQQLAAMSEEIAVQTLSLLTAKGGEMEAVVVEKVHEAMASIPTEQCWQNGNEESQHESYNSYVSAVSDDGASGRDEGAFVDVWRLAVNGDDVDAGARSHVRFSHSSLVRL